MEEFGFGIQITAKQRVVVCLLDIIRTLTHHMLNCLFVITWIHSNCTRPSAKLPIYMFLGIPCTQKKQESVVTSSLTYFYLKSRSHTVLLQLLLFFSLSLSSLHILYQQQNERLNNGSTMLAIGTSSFHCFKLQQYIV